MNRNYNLSSTGLFLPLHSPVGIHKGHAQFLPTFLIPPISPYIRSKYMIRTVSNFKKNKSFWNFQYLNYLNLLSKGISQLTSMSVYLNKLAKYCYSGRL